MLTRFGAALLRGRFVAAVLAISALVPFTALAQSNCTAEAVIQSSAQTVDEGVLVKLNGQPSKPNNATFLWERISGPGPITFIPGPTDSKPDFVAPQVTATAQLVIRLTVRGCSPLQTDTETITITIRDTNGPPPNTAPVPTATANPPIAGEGAVVALNGSATDAEGGALSYAWTQSSGPTVSITNANQANASFTAPNLTSGATLVFTLTVTDTGGLSGTATVPVNIVFANDSPFAALSCPMQVDEGDTVTLDGSASSDYEDDLANLPLVYTWRQTQGPPNIPVANETGDKVTFIAPTLGTGDLGDVYFELTVADKTTAFDTATCGVFINDVTAPVFGNDEDRIVEATSPDGADVDYGLTATDNVEGDVTPDIVCAPPSGSTFALDDPTTVNCHVADATNNIRKTAFDVLVLDRTKPVIDAHGDVAEEATGPNGANVDYVAPGTLDVVDVDLVATCAPASGSLFALGSHTVTCNATDASDNVADPTTFKVTVHDTTKPIVTVPAAIVAEATSAAGAAVTFAVSAFDIVDLAIPATCDADSGDTFPLGETTVHCSATDAHSNTGTASFKITVRDTTKPILSLPATITEEATSPDGAVVGYSATASDTVDPSVDAVCAPPSGSTFELGTTTVNCSATDDSGNTAEGSFDVIVRDTTPPTLSDLDDLLREATGPSGAPASWIVTASDLVSGDVDVTCNPTSGSTFALGITTVTCSATDDASNTATDTFTVTVQDTTPPTLSLPASFNEEATGPNGATVNFTATASDLVDGSVPVTCTPASGSVFALGAKLVQCSAKDAANNEASGAFTVTVVDTRPPTLVVPADKIVEATSPSGAAVSFITSATDIVDTNVAIVCIPASGSTFALGNHTVSCTATDDSGNEDTDSFNVLVQDTTAPTLHLPANMTAEATSASGAAVSFTTTADDVVDTSVIPVCVLPSGSTFALGTNTVSCTATDDANNASSGSFTITVRDTTAPVVASHADVIVTAATNSSAVATWANPTATDAVDGNGLTTACELPSGSSFSVAAPNLITCSVTDQAGNTGTGTFHVIVKYAFAGFFAPVDNPLTVNTVKAGQAIPVKFSLGGNQGMSIFTAGYPKQIVMPCGGSAQDAIEETLTAGSSTLTYDAGTARYHYVWKTDKAWGGTCRQLQIKFADGTTQVANFNFTR